MERITPAFLESKIDSELYLNPVGTLTICVLTMANGLHIVGESACLNPHDFDAEIGRGFARKAAFDKLWQLEGYARASTHTSHRAPALRCDTDPADCAVGGSE